MAILEEKDKEVLKVLVDTINIDAAKQAFNGMCEHLRKYPSIRTKDFKDFISDAVLYTKEKEGR